MLTIVLAAVLGLFGVVAVVAYAHQANQRAVAGLKAEPVLIAAQSIPAGTSLNKAQRAGWLISETVPASSATDAVHSVNKQNRGLVTTASVPKGQLLLMNMLGNSADAAQNGSNFNLPSKLIAVTVNLCLDEAVGEYATAGSRVAVFDTVVPKVSAQRTCDAQRQTLNAGQMEQAATLLVLPSVQVLAVGQNAAAQNTSQNDISTATADPPSSSSSSSSGEVLVTLAVNQAEAEKLIQIEELGMPYLGLLGQTAKTAPGNRVPLFQPQQLQP
jgi:pilus assembly protein CpaB